MTTIFRFAKFNAVGVLGIAVQLTVLWVLVDALGVGYLTATVIAVATAIVHNFIWHQRWTWTDRATRGRRTTPAFARFACANGLVSLVGNAVVMAALVGGGGFHPIIANTIAIATCGLTNFVLGDRVVFREYGKPAEVQVN